MVAVIALVYVHILTQPDMILHFIARFLFRIIDRLSRLKTGLIDLNKYERLRWYLKPILTCEKCVAGNIVFWLYLFYHWDNYTVLEHIFYTTFAIYLTTVLWKNPQAQ